MRVLVVSEGQHEQAGALETILRRLDSEEVVFECDRVANKAIHTVHGKGKGYYKRALRWILEAEKRGYDALVFLIDEDGIGSRVQEVRSAQESPMSPLPRAMGVAIRTFDAWMLADEKALSTVLGYTVQRQPDPETVRDPKQTCADLLTKSPTSMPQRDMYAKVASRIDVAVLSERCQAGFKPFAQHVKCVFGS